MTLPILSLIMLAPMFGAIIILLMPKDKHEAIRTVALVASGVSLALNAINNTVTPLVKLLFK